MKKSRFTEEQIIGFTARLQQGGTLSAVLQASCPFYAVLLAANLYYQ